MIARKVTFNKEEYKYGEAVITQVNEDFRTFPSTVNAKINEEGLLSVCRKQGESLATAGLLFLLEFMTLDKDIRDYVFNSPPPSYQHHRYYDFVESYLLKNRMEIEKDKVPSYALPRYKNTVKALEYVEELRPQYDVFVKAENDKAGEP